MKKKTGTRKSIGLSRRSYAGLPATIDVDARSFPIIIATETPVETMIPDPDKPDVEGAMILVAEVLPVAGFDDSRVPGMPLMDNHAVDRGIDAILGRVVDVRVEDASIVGTAILTHSRKHLLQDLAEGAYTQISAGYRVNEYEITYRDGQLPLAIAKSWTLHEASIVPVGADRNATSRGQEDKFPLPTFVRKRARTDPTKTETNKMDDIDTLVAEAEAAVDAVTDALAAADPIDLDADTLERARALRRRKARAKRDDELTPEELLEEVRKLRKLRGKREDEPVAKTDEELAAEAARGGNARTKREDQPTAAPDDSVIEQIAELLRSAFRGKREEGVLPTDGDGDDPAKLDAAEDEARSLGFGTHARKLRKLGMTAAKIRADVRHQIERRAATAVADNVTPAKRSVTQTAVVDTNEIYANRRALARGTAN